MMLLHEYKADNDLVIIKFLKNGLNRLSFILIVVLFRIALDLCYVYIVSPVFGYAGMFTKLDWFKLFESYFLVIVIAFSAPCKVKFPSDFLLTFFFLLVLIPLLSLYGLRDESRAYIYAQVAAFFIMLFVCRFPRIIVKSLQWGRTIAVAICLSSSIIVLVWLLYKGGLRYFNLNLLEVYEYRKQVADLVGEGFLTYLYFWTLKVFNIILVVFFLYKKHYTLLFLFAILQVLLFGLSAQKAVLFYLPLVLGIYYIVEKKYVLHRMTIGLVLIVVITSLIWVFFNMLLPVSLLVRRVFFLPAHLSFAYYDFFSQHNFVYLSNSVLRGFIEYSYDYPPQQVINYYLTGNLNSWANNGFTSTAYMHFGFLGIILFSLIVGFLLHLVDSLTLNKLPLALGVSLVVVPFFNLFLSADLTTALLTHGLVITLLLLWLFSARPSPRIRFKII